MAVPDEAGMPAPVVLSERHREELERGSGIHPAIVAERGYRTVTAAELPPEFPAYQRKDGLLIPIHDVWGRVGSMQVKPDQPRVQDGKGVKHETVPGRPLCIDAPRRVLPHLGNPAMPLWITEGAKKVDAALSLGLSAVIGLQGVYGWRGTNGDGGKTALPDWEAIALNGRNCIIAFDSDCMTKPEVRGALDRLAAFLKSRGAKVGYCVLPPLEDGSKCGLDDFLVQGKTFEQLSGQIVLELPPADPEEDIAELVRMRDVVSEPIDWIWKGWIPRRMLTILGGFGGDGKSTMMASLIGALTSGGRMPDGEMATRMNVLMLSAEDDPSYAIKPRLDLHGADPDRVFLLKGTMKRDGRKRWLDMRRDVEVMEGVIRAHDIGLVVVDPLSSYLPAADRNSEGDIRDALQPLQGLMERTGVGVVAIMHVGKSADGRRASQRLLGSTAFTALARSVVMVADLPEDQQPMETETEGKLKVAEVVKANYAMPPAPRLFRRPLDGAIQWLGEAGITVEECFQPPKRGGGGVVAGARLEAEALLKELLKGGSVRVTEVVREAKVHGIGEITVRRAKQALGVESLKIGYQGDWYWRLPNAPVAGAKPDQTVKEDQTFGA
jgi:putative DNA primase/helicase